MFPRSVLGVFGPDEVATITTAVTAKAAMAVQNHHFSNMGRSASGRGAGATLPPDAPADLPGSAGRSPRGWVPGVVEGVLPTIDGEVSGSTGVEVGTTPVAVADSAADAAVDLAADPARAVTVNARRNAACRCLMPNIATIVAHLRERSPASLL